MSNNELFIDSPKSVVAQWIPMGKNNMIVLNRHLGAHKKYRAPTEFGMRGEVEDIRKGVFRMRKSGVFLQTVDYGFSEYVRVHLKTSLEAEDVIGLNLDKDGLSYFGVGIPDKQLSLDEVKILIGKLTYRFADYLYPILTDVQQDLLNILYGVEDIMETPFAISNYTLIFTKSLGVEFSDTIEFIKKYPRKIDAITDWVIDHTTIEGSHILIGMRAAICVGHPSENLRIALQNMLFLKSIFNASLRLFSIIWMLSKRINQINETVPDSSYKKLKDLNLEIGKLNNRLSMLGILGEMFQAALEEKREAWDKSEAKATLPPNVFGIENDFDDEKYKAADRQLILNQLAVDLQGIRHAIEQRTDLILTKNSEYLNLIVLVLALVSVISIAEIYGFNPVQWGVVVIALIPFIITSLYYVRNYIRNFM